MWYHWLRSLGFCVSANETIIIHFTSLPPFGQFRDIELNFLRLSLRRNYSLRLCCCTNPPYPQAPAFKKPFLNGRFLLIHEVFEGFLLRLFKYATDVAQHSERVSSQDENIIFAKTLRGFEAYILLYYATLCRQSNRLSWRDRIKRKYSAVYEKDINVLWHLADWEIVSRFNITGKLKPSPSYFVRLRYLEVVYMVLCIKFCTREAAARWRRVAVLVIIDYFNGMRLRVAK